VPAVQINTALYASPNGPEDAYEIVKHYDKMGWKELGTLELTAMPTIEEEHWLPFLESSDAILVSGGNTGYLNYWLQESGFADKLHRLLERSVYFGISAGSTMVAPGQNHDPERQNDSYRIPLNSNGRAGRRRVDLASCANRGFPLPAFAGKSFTGMTDEKC
jgi:hypothetical protein